MTSKQRKELAALILVFGKASREAGMAWGSGDVSATATKEFDDLINYLFAIEVCDE